MPAKRVVVAMSGGVDSSVTAFLLKKEGYEVLGITMQVWPQPEDELKTCCGLTAVEDARRVCWQLDIPHYVVNYREIFEARVINRFCREYLAGRTPNPCIDCNREIKFGSLLEQALSLGAEYVATGHYARIIREADGFFTLWRGVDRSKDQSYVLYQMTQHQLEHTLFPLGEYTKSQVRAIAREAGLPVAEKTESQEICFVSGESYSDFVERHTGMTGSQGYFRYIDGKVLGRHRGIHRYTIGQRKGLGISFSHPLYVTRIDQASGTVWVGPEGELYHGGLLAEMVNYISGTPFPRPQEVMAKIRYLAPAVPAVATSLSDGLRVDFPCRQKAITPGQAVVLYDGDQVLGGGVISRVLD